MGRGSLNLRKNTVFEKNPEIIQGIGIEEQNAWVSDDVIFKNKNLSPKFPKSKFIAFSINFQASNWFCTKFKVIAKTWLVRP